ncbi:MAG TPA: PVC-type heme-binding CxxCH protein [Planctomycetaceae bacterium]|nr:PVC-type heme-binding CxxCH protein [Planctomycetaceae bacterium]
MRFLTSFALLSLLAPWSLAADAPPLKILFLGDNGHHRPQERFVQLEAALRPRGVALKYTDDVKTALTAETLSQFDGLMLYANIDVLPAECEKPLLDYVASGKGFIPLHCASYCFRNSKPFVELVGAQFKAHGGEVFRVENAAPDHPIMKGYGGFASWDETYIHTMHNEKDRTVLEYRVQGGQERGRDKEPWTWTRTHGKGRVFYTAWGHDQRTFGNPGFANLVERGTRWACGQDPQTVPPFVDSTQFEPSPMTAIAKDLKPFEYVDVGPKIPNYRPGAQWGLQDAPRTDMQKPLPALESMKHYSVPQGFHLELFAAEPDFVGKPIAMNWDERGRLWVCETYDYPNELQPRGEGRDRIRICEDTDGDGRADKFTVFAEQMSIPTAIVFHRGGVIVHDGSETLYLKDTNGDDKADVREVLINGWAINDTHGGVSNFQYGLDNHIWGMQGYNNSTPAYGEGLSKKSESFRQGFFRFKMQRDPGLRNSGLPVVENVEFIRSSNNNTWGFGMSEEGLIFGSTANRNPSMFMPIPNRYYERVRGWSSEQLGSIADTYLFKAITDKVRQVDQFGGYTAGAGHALYTARTYPPQFWNRTAFVCEPTGHLVGTFALTREGAGYTSTSPMNLVASDDEWASPIMAEVGPDGNVWVLDWYNYIIQHNPVPAGFKNGKGNAYESDLRDKKHGRIYRVVYGNSTSPERERRVSSPLSIERPEELVTALKRPNLLWRRHAQRLLVERGQTDVVPALVKLVADQSVDQIGLNVGAIHALWTLHGLGVIRDDQPEVVAAVTAALKHPSAGVRRNAIQVLPATEASVQSLVASGVLGDNDAQVRLAAVLALADLPPSNVSAGTTVNLSFGFGGVMSDRWMADAVIAAAANNGIAYLQTLSPRFAAAGQSLLKNRPDNDPVFAVVRRVAEHLARGKPQAEEMDRILFAATGDQRLLAATLDGLGAGWPRDYQVAIAPTTEKAIVEAFQTAPNGVKGQLAKLSSSWGTKALEKFASEIAAALLKSAEDKSLSDAERADAVKQLVSFQPASDDAVTSVLSLITPKTSSELASQFITALGNSQAPALGPQLVEQAPAFSPAVRSAAMRLLVSRPATTRDFLQAVEEGKLQLAELSLDQKQALSSHPDRTIRERARKLLSQSGGLPNADREKVVKELHHLTEVKGDVAAGKEVFKKQCAKCHMHTGEGTRIGPDLTGMAVHPKHELLTHILDPSRSVEGNFRVYTVVLEDGRVMSGMLAGESKTAIEIVDTEAKRHAIPREDIEQLVGSTKSLMPEGFEKQIKPDEFANLLEFLTARGKFMPLDLAKVANTVTTKGMFHGPGFDLEKLVFTDWSTKTFEGVPFYLVDPQGERIPNAVMLHGSNGNIPPTMPKSVTLPVRMPAKALHFLGGISGWGFPASEKGTPSMTVRLHYVDGKTEDHVLRNGVVFADYIRVVDVPDSKLAFRVRGQQVRYFAVVPEREESIDTVDLIKGNDVTSPVTMAITVESR